MMMKKKKKKGGHGLFTTRTKTELEIWENYIQSSLSKP
jgi:hypothetical protein